jgi:beta-xylosidase
MKKLDRIFRCAAVAAACTLLAPAACAQMGGSLLGVGSQMSQPPAAAAAPALPYTGDFPDPFVLPARGAYFAYGTNTSALNVPVLRSADLSTWTQAGDAMPKLPAWAASGRSLTWAPSVLARGDRYVLYFTARDVRTDLQQIGRAVATRPEGPFVDDSGAPLISTPELGGAIDASPFVDADGRAYLLWKNDGNARNAQTKLWIRELAPDGLSFAGDATPLLERTADWEKPLVEGPSLHRHGSRYYLFYSAGWWESDGYGIGYAVADSLRGPYRKVTTSAPWRATGATEAGPGGQEIFTGPAGQPWMAYHAWSPGKVGYGNGGARTLRVIPLAFPGDAPAAAPAAPSTQPTPHPLDALRAILAAFLRLFGFR